MSHVRMFTTAYPPDASARLRALSLVSKANGQLSLREAAASLGVTPRTLQRRLKLEGTTYRAVVDEARLELATRALARAPTAAAAAVVLGFSEPAAFHRAFKRWTGMTPGKFNSPPANNQSPNAALASAVVQGGVDFPDSDL